MPTNLKDEFFNLIDDLIYRLKTLEAALNEGCGVQQAWARRQAEDAADRFDAFCRERGITDY